MCPPNKTEKAGLLNQVSFNYKLNKGDGGTFMNITSNYRALRDKTLENLNVYDPAVLAQHLVYCQYLQIFAVRSIIPFVC